ncbi:MAG: sigma-70 family RNA polymerase sigma factor [Planctomycetota bacterium]
MSRVRLGETEAFSALVWKYQDRLFNTCWRICGNLEDARELTQEAFLKAFEGLATFRQEAGFYTWIYRVAVNLALSHRRTAGRRRTVSLEAAASVQGAQAAELVRRVRENENDEPGRPAGDAELHGAIARALQALDDEHRAVVVLRDLEGFDYQEIGEILEIPPGTVKSRLHRARMALREVLTPLIEPSTRGTPDRAPRD